MGVGVRGRATLAFCLFPWCAVALGFYCYCFCVTTQVANGTGISCYLWITLAVTTSWLQVNVLCILECYSTMCLASVIACMYHMRSIYEVHEMKVVSSHPSIHPSLSSCLHVNSVITLRIPIKLYCLISALRSCLRQYNILIILVSWHD